MAFFRGPNVVTNGLVLALDAANPKSYVSGSTTWRDLSGNNNSGSLLNGTSFTSLNGGGLLFDGVNDDVELNFTASSPSTTSYTYEIAFLPQVTSYSFKSLMGHSVYQGGGFSIGLHNTNRLYVQMYSGSTAYVAGPPFNTNTSNVICVTLSGRNISTYVNGNLSAFSTISFDVIKSASKIRIGNGVQGGWGASNIIVFNSKIYNRALSPQEVLQNYNAQKSRFNL